MDFESDNQAVYGWPKRRNTSVCMPYGDQRTTAQHQAHVSLASRTVHYKSFEYVVYGACSDSYHSMLEAGQWLEGTEGNKCLCAFPLSLSLSLPHTTRDFGAGVPLTTPPVLPISSGIDRAAEQECSRTRNLLNRKAYERDPGRSCVPRKLFLVPEFGKHPPL